MLTPEDEIEATDPIAPVDDPEVRSPLFKALAYAVSAVFHPLLVATYAFLFIDYFYPYQFAHLSATAKLQLLVTVVVNTLVFPFITLFIMSRLGFISSLQMRDRQERIIPLIAMGLFYFWTYLVVKQLGVGSYFTHVMLGGSLAVFTAFFFNNFFKISVHAVAAGTFLGVALSLSMISTYNLLLPLMLVILVAGLIGSSRLYLQAHKDVDVYSGYAVGIVAQLVAFTFF